MTLYVRTLILAVYIKWISKLIYYEFMLKKSLKDSEDSDELEDSDHIYLRDSKGSILCAIVYCVYTHMHPTHETEVFNLAFIASLYIMVHVTYYMNIK
jgi:hypothetical protein